MLLFPCPRLPSTDTQCLLDRPLLPSQRKLNIDAVVERARYRNQLVEERQRLCKARQPSVHAHKLEAATERRLRVDATRLAAAAAISLQRARSARSKPYAESFPSYFRSHGHASEIELQKHEQQRLNYYRQMRRNWDVNAQHDLHQIFSTPCPPPLECYRPPPVQIPMDETTLCDLQ